MRVALIYDDKARPDTTGLYCRRALGQIAEVEHFLPSERAQIPTEGFDLYLNIDDGLRYRLPRQGAPTAFWAIDTHLEFDWYVEKAPDFDLVFTAQRDAVSRLRAAGIGRVEWLPLACDPEMHRKHDAAKRHDVAFVGHRFPGPRNALLELLARWFPDHYIGNLFFEEMAEAYSASRVVFNRSIRDDVNMRVFEALACGSLLVTNDLASRGLAELFTDGVHLATYADPEELLDKVEYYLRHEEVRERIAAAGRAEVLAKHTYRHRMEAILAAVAEIGPATVARPADSPSGETSFESEPLPNEAPEIASDTGGADHAPHEPPAPDGLDLGIFEALLPDRARHVLEIGGRDAALGDAIRVRLGADVVRVAADEEAARRIGGGEGAVLVTDVESTVIAIPAAGFDAVVCHDLARLRDPLGFLRRVKGWLSPGGRLVVGAPNVRNHEAIAALLDGNWTYGSCPALGTDHARSYTRRELEKLLDRAGFVVESAVLLPRPDHESARRDWGRGSVRAGRLAISGMDLADAEEFYAEGFLFGARAVPRADRAMTSIVIAVHGQLAYTRECLRSIRQFTDEPHEIIVVDNASPDGTAEELAALPYVKLIRNAENRGFAAAVNQGIAASRGAQILLLNNDTVVTTGWLRRLLDALESDPKIGLVGPCSNFVSGTQQVETDYNSLAGLDGFAWKHAVRHAGVVEDADRLVGFCLLVRREVVDAIGTLDERFGIGCFEDDDYTLRALAAGYRTVIARNAFVHHFGGRTFLATGVDFAGLMEENSGKFREKWAEAAEPAPRRLHVPPDSDLEGQGTAPQADTAEPERAGPISAQTPAANPRVPGPYAVVSTPGGLLLTPDAVRLSVCLIVRDSSRTLRPCLESIRPWVDEMVVVDTGSLDDTPRIAEECGARVFHFPWTDSFSVARNESLRHARGEWLFWMDSDDTITPECGRRLRELAAADHDPAVLGYVAQVHCPGAGEEGELDVTVVDHLKLFRNRPDLRFEGRIHEQILPAIRRAGGEVAWTDIYVVHSGSDHTPEGRERKLKRDFHLLHLELAEQPEHPFTLFNLGMTYADCDRHEEAIGYLERSIAASTEGESHLRKAYALLVHSQMRAGRLGDAGASCRQGRATFPEDPELRFRQGVYFHEIGCLEEAERTYRELLDLDAERHFSSIDRGITGFKARHNLAIVLTDLSDLVAAEEQWRTIVHEVPCYRQGWRGLGDNLIRQGHLGEAQEVVLRLLIDDHLRVEGHLLDSKLCALAGDVDGAVHALETALGESSEDLEPLQSLAQLRFEHGHTVEAEQLLKELMERDPKDGASPHNLGTLYMRARRPREAVRCYQESLRRRPKSATTYLHLGQALKDLGRRTEAEAAWREALKFDPTNGAVQAELGGAESRRAKDRVEKPSVRS